MALAIGPEARDTPIPMQAFLDGQQIESERPTLAAGLNAGVRAAESTGRIIVEAWVDGRPLAGDELESPSDVPGTTLRLDLVSAEPRELVATTLREGAAALDQIESVQRDAGRLIQAGTMDQSIQSIKAIVETWSDVQMILERGSAILGTDLSRFNPSPFAPLAQSLSSQLATLKDSLLRQDWSALSDCLAYELTEQAVAWREAFDAIASAISSGKTPSAVPDVAAMPITDSGGQRE